MIHNQNNFLKDNKIDVVITWVDGENTRQRAKRENLLTNTKEHKRKDIAQETRHLPEKGKCRDYNMH